MEKVKAVIIQWNGPFGPVKRKIDVAGEADGLAILADFKAWAYDAAIVGWEKEEEDVAEVA